MPTTLHFPLYTLHFLKLYLIIIILVFLPFDVYSQHSWEEYFHDIYTMEDMDENAMADDHEHLIELENAPLNINTITPEELTAIPGLSLDQIDDIIRYRDRYGALRTMEELALIPSIDSRLRLFLCNFLIADKVEKEAWYSRPTLDSILHKGHGDIMLTTSIPLYNRKGDENGYLGYKYKYGLKVSGKFSDNIRYGFSGAQDAGEPFFAGENKYGMDYYTFFVTVKNIKRLSSLTIGRYRMKMGMGLILNNNNFYGKQMMTTSVLSSGTRITGHNSRSDCNYLQGAAATIDLSMHSSDLKTEATIFLSSRFIDATLNSDSSIATVITSGYHRTPSEMQKKNNSSLTAGGGHIGMRYKAWHAGVSFAAQHYSRTLNPDNSAAVPTYRTYYAKGQNLWNAGADYGFTSPRLTISGETATGNCGAVASINSLQAKLFHDITIVAIQRFYSYRYYATMAKTFSDDGAPHNESGIYLAAKWKPSRMISIDGYSDLSYHPWMRYGISRSSYSSDNSLSATISTATWTFITRYRYRLKQEDNEEKTALTDSHDHRIRLSATWKTNNLSLRTQGDVSIISSESTRNKGWMISELAEYCIKKKFTISVTAAYFHTDNYDCRFYAYERNVPGSYSLPPYNGIGWRLSSFIKIAIASHWTVCGKIGITKYNDRNTISYGLRELNASHQTDTDIQINYNF